MRTASAIVPEEPTVATEGKGVPRPADKPWFAIRVRSNFEKTTATALHERGFEEFLPVCRVRRYWSDRVKEVEQPLFPGYVLARFDPTRLVPILGLPGVVHVVGHGKTPVPVDDVEIAAVQAIVNSRLGTEPWPYLEVGDRVIIEHGPLLGHEGFLLEVKNRCRLVVGLSLLQRSVAVEIDRDWVRPLLPRRTASNSGRSGAGSVHA